MNQVSDSDDAAAFYEDPANRQPAGSGRRRRGRALTAHVPVRFTADVIARVKRCADDERRTVSALIRAVVEDEVERREVAQQLTLPAVVSDVDFDVHADPNEPAIPMTGSRLVGTAP